MRFVITFAAVAVVAGTIIPRYADRMRVEPTGVEPALLAAHPPPPRPRILEFAPRSIRSRATRSAAFVPTAASTGASCNFMVDTGASIVALTADDAAQLGIHPAATKYTMLISTANGTVRAAPTTLDMIEIGDIMVHDVAAVVMPNGALSDNLLGLSFLSRLRHFEFSDGKMMLEQ